MSGVIIIRSLLANNAALIAAVPADKIMTGIIPINTDLPAVSIAQISGVQRHSININEVNASVIDRVQVTVMAATYRLQKTIIALVRAAVPNMSDTVNGIVCDSILADIEGPDIFDADIGAYFQSIDFKVQFTR